MLILKVSGVQTLPWIFWTRTTKELITSPMSWVWLFLIMGSRTDSNTLRSAAWVDLLNHFHYLYLIKMCFGLVERFSDRETDYHPCIKEAVKERPIASRFRL